MTSSEGVLHPHDPNDPREEVAKRAETARLTSRRDNARWFAIVGVAMLFAGGLLVQIAIGGVFMVAYGVVTSMYWSWRLRRLKGDPWAYDPELDGPDGLENRRP